ncbi:hypothetical protein ACJX0J_035357, partial [Zea mays]
MLMHAFSRNLFVPFFLGCQPYSSYAAAVSDAAVKGMHGYNGTMIGANAVDQPF